MGDTPERWYWIEGRIGRQTWMLRVGGAILATIVLIGLFVAAMQLTAGDGEPSPLFVLPILAIVLGVFVFRLVQDIKRLHDLGQPGWLVFCAFIPVISLIYLVILLVQDGQPQRNQFGPDPKRRDEGFEAVADVFR